MTVARLEDEMGAGELERWRRFEQVEPFIGYRLELLGGLICSTLANINRGRNVPAFSATDFMPFLSQDIADAERYQRIGAIKPANDQDAQVMRLVLAFGGQIGG